MMEKLAVKDLGLWNNDTNLKQPKTPISVID